MNFRILQTKWCRVRALKFWGRWLSVLALCGAVETVRSDLVRTQTITLQEGWNAVHLEVFPPDPEPAAVFEGTPIDVAATYFARSSPAQFLTDPGVKLFQGEGWGVWYEENRPDAFLGTLHAVYGQRAYLVHAQSSAEWEITGEVRSEPIRWQPDAYNFVGFPVARQGGPTFEQFFAGSKAHQHNRIYRLVDGAWRRVTEPAAEVMKSGEAFWIYCDGSSEYQGPLHVESDWDRALMLGGGVDNLILRNTTEFPMTVTVRHLAGGDDSVPLSIVVRAVNRGSSPLNSITVAEPDSGWAFSLPVLEGGEGLRIPLEARLQKMSLPRQTSLLEISTDLGTRLWIPVIGIREDLLRK